MRPPARPLLFLAALLLSATLPLGAQIPRGPEIAITAAGGAREFVTGAAATENGDFLVVWTSQPAEGEGPRRVRFRLFRGDGSPRSPELGVGAPPWHQFGGRVAMRADGRFVIVWTEQVRPDDTWGVFRVLGRVFAPNLRALGPAFRLTPELRGSQYSPDVAWAGGGFVAVWQSDHNVESFSPLLARRFSPEGRPLGPEFPVVEPYEEQSGPRVAAAGSGDFVVAWDSWQGRVDGYDLWVQRFAADGSPRGDTELLFGTGGSWLDQLDVSLAMAEDGGFLAVFTDFAGDYGRHERDGDYLPFRGIVAWRYAADGTPVEYVNVNDVAPGVQEHPDVVRRPGGFYVVWDSAATKQRPAGIFARRLRLNGTPAAGGDLRVSLSSGKQSEPVVALDSLGRGIVAWTHEDPDGVRVLARSVLPR